APVAVRLRPRPDVGERPQPVDARVRPEIDEHDLPAQILRRERRRVQPAGRPLEAGQVAFRGQRGGPPPAEQAHSSTTTRNGFPFSTTYVASSAALTPPTFLTEWTVSAGTSRTSPAFSVCGGRPSRSYSSDPSRT